MAILPQLLAFYGGVSLITLLAFWVDKRAARSGGWRVPEQQLHLLELAGGWPGSFLGQRLFRHKTRKRRYQTLFWLIVLLHLLIWWTLVLERHMP